MFIGILSTCEAHIKPASVHILPPIVASSIEECVQNVWRMLLDECINRDNFDVFLRYSISEVKWPLYEKFESFFPEDDDEDEDHEDYEDKIRRMKKISLTREELEQLLAAYYNSDYNYKLKIFEVSLT